MNGAYFSLFVFSLIEASFFAMKNGIFYDFIIICANNMQMKNFRFEGGSSRQKKSFLSPRKSGKDFKRESIMKIKDVEKSLNFYDNVA